MSKNNGTAETIQKASGRGKPGNKPSVPCGVPLNNTQSTTTDTRTSKELMNTTISEDLLQLNENKDWPSLVEYKIVSDPFPMCPALVVSTRGQVTIPKNVLRKLGIKAGDYVDLMVVRKCEKC
jgi:AbrB family looped-hinge helix DNA binding protein